MTDADTSRDLTVLLVGGVGCYVLYAVRCELYACMAAVIVSGLLLLWRVWRPADLRQDIDLRSCVAASLCAGVVTVHCTSVLPVQLYATAAAGSLLASTYYCQKRPEHSIEKHLLVTALLVVMWPMLTAMTLVGLAEDALNWWLVGRWVKPHSA